MTASNSAPKKVLVIGSTGHAGVKCVEWTSLEDVPNIADYQIVVVNSCSLSEWIDRLKEARDSAEEKQAQALEKIGSSASNGLSLLKSKLLQVLRAGGIVYAILSDYRAFWRPGSYYSPIVTSYEWVPLPVERRQEPGDTLTMKMDIFARYFHHVRNWTHVFTRHYERGEVRAVIEDDLPPKPLVALVSNDIATDWQGNPVACALAFTLRRAVPDRPPGHEEYEQDPFLTSGPLVLLPPPTQVSDDDAVRILLEDFCGVAARSVPPRWAEAIAMPGDADRKAAVAKATKAFEQAQRKQQEALDAHAAAEEFKRLLYEKHLPLQEIARKTFEAMGMATVDSPVSDEFMLVQGDERVLVEVTGAGKSISGRDLSQLIKDLGNYLAKVGKDVKGLLVGNAWAGLPPSERDTPDKPIFPSDVRETAKNHSIALLSTLELFKAYCALLENKVTPEHLFRRIADGSGVVTLVG